MCAKAIDYLNATVPKIDAELLRVVRKDNGPREVYGLIEEFLARGGKRVRPALCMLSCEAVGGKAEQALPAGAAIELFHSFTLMHDDIEDDSELRRGKPCIHKLHGIPLAINAGDGLFVLVWNAVQALDLTPKKQIAVCAMLTQAFTRVLEGQAIELNWRRENNWNLRAEDYFNMAGGKTGALIAASCEVGGFAGGAKKRQLKALRVYGEAIGLAFQIQDDVLNLVGEEEKYKKEIGGDVTEGKRSLASIRALEKLEGAEKERLLKLLSSSTRDKNEILEAISLMKKSSAIDYAANEAVKLIEKAKKALDALPASEQRETLVSFADYFISRES
ncbi:polyprenyl synthetase family protein [Candidatus Micrarchaeota archaeon]|nr:polyprenyl synthetase family protein [Candidatus Micrarchaeota archaeon]